MENILDLDNYELEGEELEILRYPHPTLKAKAKQVTVFDDELKILAKNMIYTMYQAPGIGLACPQVNKSIRMFVIDVDFDREEVTLADGTESYKLVNLNPKVIINPIIKNQEGEIIYEEGCLSLPGYYEEVTRYNNITVDYQDLDGNHQTLDAEETFAVCLQHENDHLDGKVFIDRISLMKRNIIKKKLTKKKK